MGGGALGALGGATIGSQMGGALANWWSGLGSTNYEAPWSQPGFDPYDSLNILAGLTMSRFNIPGPFRSHRRTPLRPHPWFARPSAGHPNNGIESFTGEDGAGSGRSRHGLWHDGDPIVGTVLAGL